MTIWSSARCGLRAPLKRTGERFLPHSSEWAHIAISQQPLAPCTSCAIISAAYGLCWAEAGRLNTHSSACVMLISAARDGIFPRIDPPSTLCLCLGIYARARTHTLTHLMDVSTTPISHFILSAQFSGPLMCLSFCQSESERRRVHFLLAGLLSARLRCSLNASHYERVCFVFFLFLSLANWVVSRQRALAVG